MADGRSAPDRRPYPVRLRFDVMLRDPLAERDRLLEAHDVEGSRRTEIDLEARARRALARRPKGLAFAVDRHRGTVARHVAEDRIGSRWARGRDIALVDGVDRGAVLGELEHIGAREEALCIGRHVQTKKAISSDGVVIDVDELAHRLQSRIVGRVPEP